MITKEGFNEVVNTIAEIYPKDVPSIQGQKIYFMLFSKNFESDEELMKATLKVLETRVFTSFPKPAEFLEACKRKDDIEFEITQEQLNIRQAMKKYGASENVCFENPIVHKVIQNLFGSWVKLCRTDIKEFESLMKWDFEKIYKLFRESKLKEVPLFLEGSTTHQNGLMGFSEEVKVNYIGNKEKCIKWNNAYYNKNQIEAVNKDKYEKLGFIPIQVLQIEDLSKEELEDLEKIKNKTAREITESLGIEIIEKPKKTGIIRTKKELIEMLKN